VAKAETQVLNLDDLKTKRALMAQVSTMSGLWEVSLKPRRLTRTLSQNAYYFTAVCGPFRDWLREQYGDPQITTDQAHEMLKVKILGLDEKLIDGEVLRLIPRSKTLDTFEFGQFIDKAAEWLASFCNIVILPPEMFYEKEPPKQSLKQQLENSLREVKRRAG
jgi:hypothetical protein